MPLFISLVTLFYIMENRSAGSLWEAIGELEEHEVIQVLTRLFTTYEQKLEQNPDDKEAQRFMINLKAALSQVSECNLNRR